MCGIIYRAVWEMLPFEWTDFSFWKKANAIDNHIMHACNYVWKESVCKKHSTVAKEPSFVNALKCSVVDHSFVQREDVPASLLDCLCQQQINRQSVPV